MRVRIDHRTRQGFDDQLEHRFEIFAGLFQIARRCSCAGIGVDDGKVELILAGVEVDEQIVDLVEHCGDARIGPVDLVDADDRRQLGFRALSSARSGSAAAVLRRHRPAA